MNTLTHLVRGLTTSGENDVAVFSTWKPSKPQLESGAKYILGSLSNSVLVEQTLRDHDIEVVYHLAGIADIDECLRRPVDTVRYNILGTVIVLEASRKALIKRFVFASSAYVYSNSGSFYAASKHAMAGFFDSLRIELADSGVSVTMVYPGIVATEVRTHAFGPNGTSLGRSHLNETKAMTAEKCAQLILTATAQRKRELVMTFRGRLGLWLKLIAPRFIDRIASKAIGNG